MGCNARLMGRRQYETRHVQTSRVVLEILLVAFKSLSPSMIMWKNVSALGSPLQKAK